MAVAAWVIAACGSGEASTLDVFAAASTTNAVSELAEIFEAEHPGIDVRLNFAGTSTLREQLLDGAEADVFISANAAIMDSLVAAGAVDGEVRIMTANRLVLAVPTENPARVVSLQDVARADLFVGLCAAGVPCGDLAAGLLAEAGVVASVDTYEPDVRSLSTRLADQELDAALIYASDVAANADRLATVPTTPSASTTYPMATVEAHDAAAVAFVDFLGSDQSRAILAKWGFEAP